MAKTVFAILGKRAPACWHAIPAALPGMTALSCMQAEPASGSFERRGAACWLFVPSCAPSQGRRLSGSARHRLRAAAGTGPAASLCASERSGGPPDGSAGCPGASPGRTPACPPRQGRKHGKSLAHFRLRHCRRLPVCLGSAAGDIHRPASRAAMTQSRCLAKKPPPASRGRQRSCRRTRTIGAPWCSLVQLGAGWAACGQLPAWAF